MSLMARISIFIFSLVLFCCFPALSEAQEAEPVGKPAEALGSDTTVRKPVFNGLYLGVDVANPALHFLGTGYMQCEVALDVNLLHRYFPVLELGYGSYDNAENGVGYKAAAPFFRVGMNYNMKYKQNDESHFYFGLRYGFSAFKYDISSHNVVDEVWGGAIDFNRSGIKAVANWMEIVGGIRVAIYRNFMMGWSFRWRARLKITEHDDSAPWYVPGFGYNKSSNIGFTYALIYKF